MEIYGGIYLNRQPKPGELETIEESSAETGFVGCICAIDFCKVKGKNFP